MGEVTSSPSQGPAGDGAVWIPIDHESSVGAARRTAGTLAERAGLGEHRAAEVAIAVSEAASNLAKHAENGVLMLRVRDAGPTVIDLLAVDSGPGMASVDLSRRDGHSTTGTLGIGFGAIGRMADELDVHSRPGHGTVLAAAFTAKEDGRLRRQADGLARPISGETVCGDGYLIEERDGHLTAVVFDGLGHGPAAALATRTALEVFQASDETTPRGLLGDVHRAIGSTRGGAAGIVRIDLDARSVAYAGLGNISGWVAASEGWQSMVSIPGIVGHQARSLREFTYELPQDSTVVLHSDGLSSRRITGIPAGLGRHSPLVIAATLLRDAGIRRDDSCVLVLKPDM
ncbi:Anti-sigma regulatory factor (Ser/Thr protein kinase) [Marinactinospora thermotolerans DSM 45154]|uniref:Anti-sigma regulatory factor (Ser/Thr protein kinase) n=1 Tax=Marinactinospora thermotolerans DSM 45154 TaxID=1122192 RepID=A0A1T4T4L6_9ACTN|nr:Anti-sigma regulatory factor (Ser/Thr protein kinase) [Marinactinospora thermotolerans DSM 45154]